VTDLRAGDIIAYKPETLFRRDGLAQVDSRMGNLIARDTFDTNDTRLTDAELTTAKVLFNLDEFEESRYADEEHYAPADIHILHTRKGIEARKFVRRGATTLSEAEIVRRRAALNYDRMMRARAELLSPLADQAFTATTLPVMTVDETGALTDTIHWCQRASRDFDKALDHVVNIQNGKGGNLHFATVLADEDHYELVRARRALDSKLAALREAAVAT